MKWGKEGLQKGKGARKGQTAGSELGEAVPRHQGQWKPVQPCLGGGGALAVRPEHGWDAPSMTEVSIKHLI